MVDELSGVNGEYMLKYNHESSHSVIGFISHAKFERSVAF